jgi:hypothetical protein
MPRTVEFDKGLGWRPDVPSFKDFRYSAQLHDKVDTALIIKPHGVAQGFRHLTITDQRETSACTGHSSAYHWELERKLSPRSPLFNYYYGRKAINEVDKDDGAYIRDVFDGLRHEGSPRDDLWQDTDANLHLPPSERAELDAAKRLPVQTLRIDTPGSQDQLRQSILACISTGHSFVTGVSCFSSFFSDRSTRTGLFLTPDPSESFEGGHALCFGEYWLNDTFKETPYAQEMRTRGIPDSLFPKDIICAAGSWSKDYLLNGYHYFDLNYVTNRDLADDTWTSRGK